jgi:hypothetical protein
MKNMLPHPALTKSTLLAMLALVASRARADTASNMRSSCARWARRCHAAINDEANPNV